MAFSFFGKIDRDFKGTIRSQYPAWMLHVQRDMLAEEIDGMKRQLRSGSVDDLSARESLKDEIKKSEVRLLEIDKSKPKITAPMLDKMAKHYEELSIAISAAMFTRYEEKNKFVDTHEELRRMEQPCIKVDSELAFAANLKLDEDSKASRNDATKLWKIMGHVLGLPTNAERLRKNQ